jgi:osmoprotectant transport system ATP-binding protein
MGNKIAVMRDGKLEQVGHPHEILSKPATQFVESLVGNNRVVKRFSLIQCDALQYGSPIFTLETEEKILEEKLKEKEFLRAHDFVGIVDKNGNPTGYIPLAKYEHTDTIPLHKRIKPNTITIQNNKTLYDALGLLFSSGHQCVFCMDQNGKVNGLVTMADLFEAVRVNDEE